MSYTDCAIFWKILLRITVACELLHPNRSIRFIVKKQQTYIQILCIYFIYLFKMYLFYLFKYINK